MNPFSPKKLQLHGQTGQLASRIIRHWLLGIRETNPAILDMFRDRDHHSGRRNAPTDCG